MNPDALPTLAQWLDSNAATLRPVEKATGDTLAWFAMLDGRASFLKFFPQSLYDRAAVERDIAGANLHPAIIPLRQTIPLSNGALLIYDHVVGDNLGPMDTRKRFQLLPRGERTQATAAIFESLSAICDAGFMIVDWYEGNMMYDFARHQIWLFDWELCRRGNGFALEMDNNYGSSRLMAPEEFLRGSTLDERTLVFNLGRYALMTLPELAEPFAALFARATHPARAQRFATLGELTEAFAPVFADAAA